MKTNFDYLILLSTDSPSGEEIIKDDIIRLHTLPKHLGGMGLARPKIDELILVDGTLQTIIAENNTSSVDMWGISQGKNGITGTARYIAYVGGRTKDDDKSWDTRTNAQKATLMTYVRYQLLKNPDLIILGLEDVPALKGNEQPPFNVAKWLKSIGVSEKNRFEQS